MDFPKRKNHRLKNFDYGSFGYYYITICTKNNMHVLCSISGATQPIITVSEIGKKVTECFYNIEKFNQNVKVDAFVLMPNHIHAIIILENTETIKQVPKKYSFEIHDQPNRRSIQSLIRDFKSITTRYYKNSAYRSAPSSSVRATSQTQTSLWKESFYDEIIRTEDHYIHAHNYIANNPSEWLKKHARDCRGAEGVPRASALEE